MRMDLRKRVARKFSQIFFARCITNRLAAEGLPWEDARPITFRSRDGLRLHGWEHVPQENARGTVFF